MIVFAAGSSENSTDENQVERSPSSSRNRAPVTVACVSFAPTAVTLFVRPAEAVTVVRVEMGGGSFSCFATFAPSKRTGPQLW